MSIAAENYYQILGVESNASALTLAEAFAARRAEFIQTGRDPNHDAAFNSVSYAYEVLSDSNRRAFYDSLLVETAVPSLKLKIQSSGSQIPLLDLPQIIYLLLELRPDQMDAKLHLLPLNLCLVIDRSTSMRGKRLEKVRDGVQLILEKLAPSDIISVISFSDRAEIVLPARRVREQSDALERIQSIQASGGTEIFQGLAAGVQQMRQFNLDEYTNHLILLTDGHTYGDADKSVRLAGTAAKENIQITAFGIGAEWNDQFLDALVAPSKGQSGYIAEPDEILTTLEERINGLGNIYARNVLLTQQWPARVTLQQAFKLTPYPQQLSIEKTELRLGDIEGRAQLTCLLELLVAPQSFPTRINIPLQLSAEIPGKAPLTLSQQIKLTVLENVTRSQPKTDVVKAARLQNLYQLNEKALQEVESGDLSAAATRMRQLTSRYLQAGEPQLAHQAEAEAQRLTRTRSVSPEGWKQLKYGTRMLIGQTVLFDKDDSL